jgi:hypothetical protein
MRRTEFTYHQLDGALRALGFSYRFVTVDPPVKLYEHKKSGATVMLPPYPESDRVLDYHLVYARTMLDEYGIADEGAFTKELQKAS